MMYVIFYRIKLLFTGILNFFFEVPKEYSIKDDLITNDDVINFDNAVSKSRKKRVKVSVNLSNGKIITVKAFK